MSENESKAEIFATLVKAQQALRAMPENESKADIFAALVKAQQAARAVEKDAHNKFHGYGYASAEALIAEARGALSDAGLACCVYQWLVVEHRMVVTYLLVHASGQSMTFSTSTPVVMELNDKKDGKYKPADKAEHTALTYNLGYFLRGLLLLPRVEPGTDVDQRDDRNHDPFVQQRDEFSSMLAKMPEEKQQKISEWMQKRGESLASYTFAIKSMRDELARAAEVAT